MRSEHIYACYNVMEVHASLVTTGIAVWESFVVFVSKVFEVHSLHQGNKIHYFKKDGCWS